ncbi:MAG: endolytic transglycosylase MltG [Holosporales bacterium]|nr:endolytic transglycosylase MltG [Holosporales bacterium]
MLFLLSLYIARSLFSVRKHQETSLLIYRPVRFSAVAKTLYESRIAPDPLFARLAVVAIWALKGEGIPPGKYDVAQGASLFNFIKSLAKQPPQMLQFVFPTGFTNAQVIKRLASIPTLTGHITRVPMEGMLFPSNYHYAPGDSRQSIIDRMQYLRGKALNKALTQKKFDVRQVLTLASIIEKETSHDEERCIVASVYLNRLRKNMRMQACPTVIYSVTYGQKRRRNFKITKQQLFNDSAYNTYRLKGLPPTSVCNPSKSSIMAVVYPAETDFLFFASEGDKSSGQHKFSKSFQGHIQNQQLLSK